MPASVRRRSAFTLMEILIGLAVLLLFVGIIWQLMSGWMRDTSIGIWRETCSQSVQRATARIRKEIESASYPTANTPETVVGANGEAHFLVVNPEGGGTAYTGGEAWDEETWAAKTKVKAVLFGPGTGGEAEETVILTLVKGTPGYARVPGFPDRPVTGERVRLLLTGKKVVRYKGDKGPYGFVQDLVLETTPGAPSDTESFAEDAEIDFSGASKRQVLVEDVNAVIAWAENLDGEKTDAESYVPVGVKFLCVETGRGRATITGRVFAEPKTGVWVK